MKINAGIPAIVLLALSVITGCNGNRGNDKVLAEPVPVAQVNAEPQIGNETALLLADLKESGDYVNSNQFPSLIRASIVNDELGGNNLVIDLRSPLQFADGHISGAVNRQFTDLPSYFGSGIRPFEYDKIILVCDDGQLSGYTTALLRLMGYGNVYAMRWGMSAWNRENAESGWLAGLSGKYESALDTVTAAKPAVGAMPALTTGFSTAPEVSAARFKALFEAVAGSVLITADEVFANPEKYFVINLERKDKYDSGHIPGAVRYKPENTLGFPSEMATIPVDRTVVLYCGTGHNSAFATAYLRLFGYDARTLKYGNNSFMYDRMVADKVRLSWTPFSEAEINEYPTVK
jgi:rhodanese-related sulfurtransferase